MTLSIAARLTARLLRLADRGAARAEAGQGTVEYAGLAMAVGVLLLAVASYLSGKDHGIGSIVTGAIKSAIQHATAGK
jgi:hypothetical protein